MTPPEDSYASKIHSYMLDELSQDTVFLVENFLPHMHTVLVPKATIIGEKKSHSVIFTVAVLIGGEGSRAKQPKGFTFHRNMKEITDLRLKLEKASHSWISCGSLKNIPSPSAPMKKTCPPPPPPCLELH